MGKKALVLAATLMLCFSPTMRAHHVPGHEGHDELPQQPVVPQVTQTVVPPVVEVPPPVVQPPTVEPVVTNLNLPLLPTSAIVPTDISGISTGPDANMFKKVPSTPEELIAAAGAKDERYEFTGVWIPFSSEYVSFATPTNHYLPVRFLADKTVPMQQGHIEQHTEPSACKTKEAAFMPTRGASYSKINNEHLALKEGAVLVQAGDKPVFVSTTVNGKKAMTRVTGGALAMVSAFDQRTTVVNLTDRCCGALVAYVPAVTGDSLHSVTMRPGQVLELYSLDSKPTSNLVATKIEVNERVGANCGLLVSRCHYVRALKKYDLIRVLTKADLNRVLKTAAAVAYIRRSY